MSKAYELGLYEKAMPGTLTWKERLEAAKAAGIEPVTLGKRILRTETAGLTVMAWIMYQLEEE